MSQENFSYTICVQDKEFFLSDAFLAWRHKQQPIQTEGREKWSSYSSMLVTRSNPLSLASFCVTEPRYSSTLSGEGPGCR